MKIVGIEPIVVDVPLVAPVRGVHGPTAVQRSVLVRITTDDGIEGWGNVVVGHGFGLTLSTLAEAVVAATSAAVMPGCEAVGPLKMAGDVVAEPVQLGGGRIQLTDAPGLGATIETDSLKRYRVAP